MAELLVSVDLLKYEFEVYRSVSPSSSCDIIAMKNKKTYPIEIRTGFIGVNEKTSYPKNRIETPYLAIYLRDKEKIEYIGFDPRQC